jgi:hypothetical protein
MMDAGDQFASVMDIPLPEGLTDLQRIEFQAFKESLGQLESEWRQTSSGENEDVKTCFTLLDEIAEKRKSAAKQRLDLRLEVIEKQVERQRDKIRLESEEYKRMLFERLVSSYSKSYKNITGQLKDLMGKVWMDYDTWIAQNGIEFPQIPAESQMKTRTQQPEETKLRLSAEECESDLRQLQSIFDACNDTE